MRRRRTGQKIKQGKDVGSVIASISLTEGDYKELCSTTDITERAPLRAKINLLYLYKCTLLWRSGASPEWWAISSQPS